MKIGGMIKLGIVLALYATAACVGLAFVYTGTEKVIAERAQVDLKNALTELFPSADGFTEITGAIPSSQNTIFFGSEYAISRGGELLGAAIRATGSSYGGPITVLVGVGIDGKISGAKILEHSDTPGLGANAASAGYFVNKAAGLTFYGQFSGKALSEPFEAKNDVAAITAATITSRAVASVVKNSGTAAFEWLNTQGGLQ
jgi:electron transport complex protein RnfG